MRGCHDIYGVVDLVRGRCHMQAADFDRVGSDEQLGSGEFINQFRILSKQRLETKVVIFLQLGNLLASLCMVCNGFSTVTMRYLQHVHVSVSILAYGVVGTVQCFIVSLFTEPLQLPENQKTDWMLALLIAGLFFLGQLSLAFSLQMEEAGVVSLVRTCDVLFAFIWQVVFLHQEANQLR